MTSPALLEREDENTRQNVKWFTDHFGKSRRLLACYAALPLILTPELLNNLRHRYLRDVPWDAESDLLLSDLCSQIGAEQYIMDARVRAFLLNEMVETQGIERLQEVARHLLQYIDHGLRKSRFTGKHELQTQRWAAMAYLDEYRDAATDQIARAFRSAGVVATSGKGRNRAAQAEVIRLTGIIQALAPQLKKHPLLIRQARLVSQILAAPESIDREKVLQNDQPVWIGDVDLPPLAAFLPRQPAPIHPAALGLNVLAELIDSPQLRAIVLPFSDTFHAAIQHVELVGDCIALLDLMYRLQFHCYTGVVQEARYFPDNELTMSNLRHYESEVENIVDQMQDIASRAPFTIKKLEWIAVLEQAHEQLREALEVSDSRQLNQAIVLMKRGLDRQIAQLNTYLSEAAQSQELTDLATALQLIDDMPDQPGSNPQWQDMFYSSGQSLSRLNDRLRMLIEEHSRWHTISLYLDGIEDSLEQDLESVMLHWQIAKELVEPLYQEHKEKWVFDLMQDGEKLEQAIIARNSASIKRFFRPYYSRINRHLYQITVALRDMEAELRQIAAPLAAILRMIG